LLTAPQRLMLVERVIRQVLGAAVNALQHVVQLHALPHVTLGCDGPVQVAVQA
jgi:hypothetical protein